MNNYHEAPGAGAYLRAIKYSNSKIEYVEDARAFLVHALAKYDYKKIGEKKRQRLYEECAVQGWYVSVGHEDIYARRVGCNWQVKFINTRHPDGTLDIEKLRSECTAYIDGSTVPIEAKPITYAEALEKSEWLNKLADEICSTVDRLRALERQYDQVRARLPGVCPLYVSNVDINISLDDDEVDV